MDLKEQIKGELIKQKEEEIIKRKEANSKIEEFILYVDKRPLSINTKKFLNDEGLKYIEKDITEDQELMTKVTSITNMNSFPTALINGNYLVYRRDFQNPQQLTNLLETFEVSKYDDSRRVLERVKTLNFHINTAFGRLDQLLRKIETKINTDEHESTD